MSVENQSADKSANHRDDLQKIKGIAQKTADVLNHLGIYRYSDLAEFTPDRLADQLKPELPFISALRIENEDWLGQARKLAERHAEATGGNPLNDQAGNSHQVPEETPDKADPDENSSLLADDLEEDMPKVSHKHWREVADFFVSFGFAIDQKGEEHLQTRAHHSQIEKSAHWAGIATQDLIDWMLAQAKLSSPEKTEVETETPPHSLFDEAAGESTAFIELSDLWVSEVETAKPTGGRQPATALRAESKLDLSGAAAAGLTEDRLSFIIELFLVDTETNQSTLTASYPGVLTPGQLTYEIEQDFPKPSVVGRYQLYLVAMLLPPGAAVAHLQGPLIRVEA